MGAVENFSAALKLETPESLKRDLAEATNSVSLYKKATNILEKMERHFDGALGWNCYDYFDGSMNVVAKTEFEKKAKELNVKAKELYDRMGTVSALYLLGQSKLGISSIEANELNAIVQDLLATQERAKRQVLRDLQDGVLNDPGHIAPDFVKYTREREKVSNNESIIEIKFWGLHKFRFISLENYDPPTSPQKIYINSMLRDFMEKFDRERAAKNIDQTNPEEMQKWLIAYLQTHRDILEKFGIKDYRKLAPKEAILLAVEIVGKNMDYDHSQIEYEDSFRASFFDHDNDTDSIPELLREGKGVCRNYAHAVKGIFDALKSLQNPSDNRIANTYANLRRAEDSNYTQENWEKYEEDSKGAGRREIVDTHMWNTFFTVTPSGEIQTVNVDTTFADDPNADTNNPDYTNERFFFDIEAIVIAGLLTQEKKIAQLKEWSENPSNTRSPSYRAVLQEIGDYHLRRGEQEEGVAWYKKMPSVEDEARIKRVYDIPQKAFVTGAELQLKMEREEIFKSLAKERQRKEAILKGSDPKAILDLVAKESNGLARETRQFVLSIRRNSTGLTKAQIDSRIQEKKALQIPARNILIQALQSLQKNSKASDEDKKRAKETEDYLKRSLK